MTMARDGGVMVSDKIGRKVVKAQDWRALTQVKI